MTPPPTILVVDDDADLLRVAVRVLKLHGYEVLSADRCEAALQLLEGREDAIDLLLTDIEMPGMCGDELAARLEQRYPDLRILYTSGYPSKGTRDYIEKPYAMSELAKRVREVLDATRPAH